MPQQVQQHLTHLQEVLLQEAVLRTGSALFEVMTAGKQWQGDFACHMLVIEPSQPQF